MKSLKDYFSSPKSSDVSLNDSVCGKPESPVEIGLPFKRKSNKSLSNKNSKRKKLSVDSSIQRVNTSQNSSLGLDESIEEFDVIQPKSSKKRRKKTDGSKTGKPLSLKKRKPVKSDENLQVNKTQEQLLDSKSNFFNKVKKDKSVNNEKSIDKTTDTLTLKDTNHEQLPSSLIKGNLIDKLKDKNDEKSVTCENNPISVKDKNTGQLTLSIKDNFFVKVKDEHNVKTVETDSVLGKNQYRDELPSTKGNLLDKLADKSADYGRESGNKKKNSKNKRSLKKTKANNKKKIEAVKSDKVSQNEKELKVSKTHYDEAEVKLSEIEDSSDIPKENCLDVAIYNKNNNDDKKRVESNSVKVFDQKVDNSSIKDKSAQENDKNTNTGVKSSNTKRNPKVSGIIDETLVTDEIPSGSKRKRKRRSDELSEDIKNDDSIKNGEVSTPEKRRSLLNYFNKVDKNNVASVSQEKTTIKVKAIVHEPRSTESSTNKPLIKKKARKSRKQPDFDLITSEEDCSLVDETPSLIVTPKRPPWQMRINLQSPCLNGVVNSEDEESNTCSEMVTLNEESNTCSEVVGNDGEISTSLSKEDNDVIVLDEDSKTVVQIESTGQVSKTASLKGAGTFAAYFGVKSASKKENKPEERSVATKLFLQSPAPPIIKKIIQQNASEVVEGLPAPFPVHSHVRQQNNLSSMWNLPRCQLNLKSSTQDIPLPSIPQFTSLCDLKEEISKTDGITSKTVSTNTEIKIATKHLKEKETTLPIKKWLEGLRGMKKNSTVCEMWNEKYRPKTTEEVLIEKTNVCLLSDWLNTFQSRQPNGSDTESSGDEFINDKDEKVCKYGNTALLVGPPGVGKTAAVYAAAKQNGYQVLELNASCNRNGKKVHLEFSEATQSHKVETKSLFKSKSKKKDKNKQSNKKSLLLIEDSDLIFNDLDDGYVNCLSLLQSSSKRPLVLVANDANCKHLMKLIPSRSTISLSFQHPCPHMLSCFLKSMSLVEGNVMPQEACDLLVESTKGDLRKAVVNLQFYGPLYKQLDRRKLCLLDESLSSFKDSSFETKDEALATVRRAKTLCTFDILSSKKDCGRFSWFRESTTVEPRLDDAPVDSLRNDIAKYLTSFISACHQPFSSCSDSLSAGDELSEVADTSVCLSRRAIACDYLSSLRDIARTETIRLAIQTKRNKRYFNHLHNLGVDTSHQRMLDNLCSTLYDHSQDEP